MSLKNEYERIMKNVVLVENRIWTNVMKWTDKKN